jgi:hypothetical protein
MYFLGEDGGGSGSSVPADMTLEQFISDCRQKDGPFYWWLDEDENEMYVSELPITSVEPMPGERIVRVIGNPNCYGWAVESEVPDGTRFIGPGGTTHDNPYVFGGVVEIGDWY